MDQDYVCKVFADSVAETAPHEPALPLVHTTSAYRFDLIAEKGLLKATKCNVYHGESLLYLFYGRLAFRPPRRRQGHRARTTGAGLPGAAHRRGGRA